MKENIVSKVLSTMGGIIIFCGAFVSVMKGVDRFDVLIGAEGVVKSLIAGTLFIGVASVISLFQAKYEMANPSDEYKPGHYVELVEKKRKGVKISGVICISLSALYILYVIICIIVSPFYIDNLIEEKQYEQAFDSVIKSKLGKNKKNEYIENLIPFMQAGYSAEMARSVVLNIDDKQIISEGNRLYLKKGDAKAEFLYKAGEYDVDARGRLDKDFIYSGGQVLFVEYIEGYGKSYKNVVMVDLKTKHHQIVDHESECYYFDKLKDGRVLLSDNPTLVYDPFTGKLSKEELTETEREYIYSTMG